MKNPCFSVLLPTRNRLDLARSAIDTVRRQTYRNWQLVISDNCSQDDVAGYVRSLGESRIKYVRTETPVAVTDNWNNALDHATGDLIVMLGDDDGLVPGYFERAITAMEELDQPDFIHHGAYHFLFPGVDDRRQSGELSDQTQRYALLGNMQRAGMLQLAEARRLGAGGLGMRMLFGFNMQYYLFTRRFVEVLKRYGPFFQGPFPDYYTANMAMLTADRIGVVPEPWVVIGISPKSYGAFYISSREKQGTEFLGNDGVLRDAQTVGSQLLPGNPGLSSWLLSIDQVRRNLGENRSPPVAIDRYRAMQIFHTVRAEADGSALKADVDALLAKLTPRERMVAMATRLAFAPARILPKSAANGWLKLSRWRPGVKSELGQALLSGRELTTIADVYAALDSGSVERSAGHPAHSQRISS